MVKSAAMFARRFCEQANRGRLIELYRKHMNPVVVIPTFVSTRSQREGGSIITTYDHPTPLSQEGELPRCLE